MSATPPLPNFLMSDGSYGYIPAAGAQAAVNDGHTPGQLLHFPDGTKGVVPNSRIAEAMKDGAKNEGQYTQPQSDAQGGDPSPHGFVQSLVSPIPMTARSIYHNFTDAPRSADEAQGVAVGPSQAAPAGLTKILSQVGLGLNRTLIDPTTQAIANVKQDAKSGSYAGMVPDALEGVPVVGGLASIGKQAAEQVAGGDKLGATGTVLGNLLAGGLGEKAVGRMRGATKGAAILSPEAQSAREITGAINPAPRAYPQVLEAVKDQAGNVLDYGRKMGQSITAAGSKYAVPSFGELAKGLYKTMADHYETNVLGPHQDLTLPDVVNKMKQLNATADPGYGSVQEGELAGNNPTLGQIDQRIVDISNEQKSANRQPTPGQVMGATDAQLTSEKAHLSDLLHRSLGDLNDTHPDNIQGIRKQMAQLNLISGETQGGANATTRGANGQANGAGTFIGSPKATILHFIESKIPGLDPESTQGRRLVSALKTSPLNTGGVLGAEPFPINSNASAMPVRTPEAQAAHTAAIVQAEKSAAAINQTKGIAMAKIAHAAAAQRMTLADYIKAASLNP